MAQLFFLDSPKTAHELLGDNSTLVDEVVTLIGFETDEEYLVLSGIVNSLIAQEGINYPLSSVSVFSEVNELGAEYAYLEVGLDSMTVSRLPPGMVARFDQYSAEAVDDF